MESENNSGKITKAEIFAAQAELFFKGAPVKLKHSRVFELFGLDFLIEIFPGSWSTGFRNLPLGTITDY